ncbi:hypothetical protein [Brevundimonas sp.]|uniref:hypothetical protein n=1 Tax=Brevundimonas sp. TaxID=1871086 RepID=UPI0025803D94|nr:hypothetical protein [Brevundimonas sp.]
MSALWFRLVGLGRSLTPRVWLVIAVLVGFVLVGGYCAQRGAAGERDRQAAENLKTERRAGAARETAASERLNDTQTIRNRQEERDHAAEAYPDGVPDDRELRRRCRQLRDAGRDLPACR